MNDVFEQLRTEFDGRPLHLAMLHGLAVFIDRCGDVKSLPWFQYCVEDESPSE